MTKRNNGFTILEMMIAIAIFGFLMTMIAQIMRGEIRMFNQVSRQSEIEEKARTAIVQIMDEIRLNRFTYYSPGSESYDQGVYTAEPDQTTKCLIDIHPQPTVITGNISALPSGTKIFYDYDAKQLWYRDPASNSVHLIADEIKSVTILPASEHLVQIYLEAKDDSGELNHELLTWVRLY